ncbi:hypothetical protein TNCV_4244811 [Trichonephila clavipes]|nr:hypothetical protein TNCV_4244811 [Trichonephila clavipes]
MMVHYQEGKLLSGIDFSEKAGKVSKLVDTLYVRRLSTTLRASKKVSVAVPAIAQIAESVGISEAICQRLLVEILTCTECVNSSFSLEFERKWRET